MMCSNEQCMSCVSGDSELLQEIHRLRETIQRRDQEIADLRSHLDKYQAVFSFSGNPSALITAPLSPRTAAQVSKKRTRTRLFGISAEPAAGESTSSASGRDQFALKTYPKDES